jgi:hypothetical protein
MWFYLRTSFDRRRSAMNSMNRVRLTVLFLTVGVLCAASPALADKPPSPYYYIYTFALVPPQTDAPEPQASGRGAVESDVGPLKYTSVNVNCKHLGPGQQYRLMVDVGGTDITGWPIDPFVTGVAGTTDKHGNFEAQITLSSEVAYYGIYDVWIENDAGEVVLEVQRQSKK